MPEGYIKRMAKKDPLLKHDNMPRMATEAIPGPIHAPHSYTKHDYKNAGLIYPRIN